MIGFQKSLDKVDKQILELTAKINSKIPNFIQKKSKFPSDVNMKLMESLRKIKTDTEYLIDQKKAEMKF